MNTQEDDARYIPHDDEPFMCERQIEWFRKVLVAWREDILATSGKTLEELKSVSLREPDIAERAANESDWSTELRSRDRQRKLLAKISDALRRINEGDYGYCDVTGEPIALGRLIARPIANMTVHAQEVHERRERVSRAA